MKNTIQISVRELIEYAFRSGDLASGFVSRDRAVEGTDIHKKIQDSRPEEYSPEVAIVHVLEADNFILEISGKIDGIYKLPDKIIIEEIKSTYADPPVSGTEDKPAEHGSPVHWAQLKCYAYFYTRENNLNDIDIQLVYYHIKTDETSEYRLTCGIHELEEYFNGLICNYIEWMNAVEAWKLMRDESINKTDFPYPSYRQGQREMAVSVFNAIKNQNRIIIQAPTGIGKTIAALFPAIKALGLGHVSKLFYLTGRTTGRIAAENAVNELRRKGLKLKTLTINAKEKICACTEIFCNMEECRYAAGYYDRVGYALKDAFSNNKTFGNDDLTGNIILQVAEKHIVCPFELSLDLSLWADCIICDYNYAFDPRVYLRRFFLFRREDYAFLVDEAHNLVDRARDMFSAEIFKKPFLDLKRDLKGKVPEIYKILTRINAWLIKARKEYDVYSQPHSARSLPEDLIIMLKEFLEESEKWLSRNIKASFFNELFDLYFQVYQFITISGQYDEKYAVCYEKINGDLRIKLFCIDPSDRMEEAFKRSKSSMLFSATMTPAEYFRDILGLGKSTSIYKFMSPFPEENLLVIIQNNISTLYKERAESAPEIACAIFTLIKNKKGNYLMFFPSYQYMKMVYESFILKYPDTDTVVQTAGMKENERVMFLERFSCDNERTLAGFAVMGGIFGEGIDLVGDRLTGAVITGVGLPGICLERDLIRDYFEGRNGSGFEFSYMYPGINRVLQAAGRVIRSEIDRGIVLLIDKRFSTYRYRTLLPEEWRIVEVNEEKNLDEIAGDFWKGK